MDRHDARANVDDEPQTLLQSLVRCLIWTLDAGGVLVLCLDQLEYMYQDNADSANGFAMLQALMLW